MWRVWLKGRRERRCVLCVSSWRSASILPPSVFYALFNPHSVNIALQWSHKPSLSICVCVWSPLAFFCLIRHLNLIRNLPTCPGRSSAEERGARLKRFSPPSTFKPSGTKNTQNNVKLKTKNKKQNDDTRSAACSQLKEQYIKQWSIEERGFYVCPGGSVAELRVHMTQ